MRTAALTSVGVAGSLVQLGIASEKPHEVPLTEVRRLIGVMSGGSFFSQTDDFFVLEVTDAIAVFPWQVAWFGELVEAEGRILERTGRIFQGHCGMVPRRWRSAGGLGPRVKPALHAPRALDEFLALEGGLQIDPAPKPFGELQWNL